MTRPCLDTARRRATHNGRPPFLSLVAALAARGGRSREHYGFPGVRVHKLVHVPLGVRERDRRDGFRCKQRVYADTNSLPCQVFAPCNRWLGQGWRCGMAPPAPPRYETAYHV